MTQFNLLKKDFTKILKSLFITSTFIVIAFNARAETLSLAENYQINQSQSGSGFSFRLSSGYLQGEARELVYPPANSGTSNDKVSELIWKIDELYMVGSGVSIKPYSWMSINLDGWFKLTDGAGTMDDYDWLDSNNSDWTHWSHHDDTIVTKAMMLDFNADFISFVTPQYQLKGIIGYKRDTFEWEAWGGKFVYSDSGFRDFSGTFTDTLGIKYEQTFNVPYLGLGLIANFNQFHIDSELLYSSYVSSEAVDHHYARNLIFTDKFSKGKYIAFNIAGVYDLSEMVKLRAAFDYQKYRETIGDISMEDITAGTTTNYQDQAGSELEIFMVSASLIVDF